MHIADKNNLSKRIEFRRQNIESGVPKASGIYVFWINKMCIYVGKAVDLQSRLIQHWKGAKNDDLRLYIQTQKNSMEITFVTIENNMEQNIFDVEQSYIDLLKPQTNKINARAKK